MAIIKCPECGKEISDKAASCPNCGFPLIKGQPEKEKPKEYTVEINDSMYIQATSETIKVFYKHNQIMESPVDDFVLNYSKEEPDDFSRSQLKIAFSTPNYKDSFKICVNANSEKYEITKDFLVNIADKYFKKDFVSDWYLVNEYARNHADKFKSGETNVNIQKVQNNASNQSSSFSYQQFQEEEKKNSVFASTGFTVFMILIFWPIGLFTMWKYKHFKKGTRIALSIIFPVLAVFVLSNGGLNSDSASTPSPTEQNAYEQEIQDIANEVSEEINNSSDMPTPEPVEESAPDYVTVGSTFEVNGLQITVDDASTDFQDYEDEYGLYTPADGMKYAKVSFTYNNVGNTDKYASIYDFKCYADNQTCEQTYGLDNRGFINTNLSSGRSVSFSTYYSIPIDSQSVELEYTANVWTDEKVLIKLQ